MRTGKPRRGFVYFAGLDLSSPVKIGFSSAPPYRMQRLEADDSNPRKGERMRVFATIAGTMAEERREHARFSKLAIGHEWFRPAPDLIERITSLAAQRKRFCVLRDTHHPRTGEAVQPRGIGGSRARRARGEGV